LMPAVKPHGIASLTIRREEVGLAVRADHPLAEMDPIPVERLRGEPMGLPPAAANPNLISALRRWLVRPTGEELNIVSEDPTDLAMQTVAKSASAAILIIRRYAPMPPADGSSIGPCRRRRSSSSALRIATTIRRPSWRTWCR